MSSLTITFTYDSMVMDRNILYMNISGIRETNMTVYLQLVKAALSQTKIISRLKKKAHDIF